jgi:hypothetical protein
VGHLGKCGTILFYSFKIKNIFYNNNKFTKNFSKINTQEKVETNANPTAEPSSKSRDVPNPIGEATVSNQSEAQTHDNGDGPQTHDGISVIIPNPQARESGNGFQTHDEIASYNHYAKITSILDVPQTLPPISWVSANNNNDETNDLEPIHYDNSTPQQISLHTLEPKPDHKLDYYFVHKLNAFAFTFNSQASDNSTSDSSSNA